MKVDGNANTSQMIFFFERGMSGDSRQSSRAGSQQTSWSRQHQRFQHGLLFQERKRQIKGVRNEWHCRLGHSDLRHAAVISSCLAICLGLFKRASIFGRLLLALGSTRSGRLPTTSLGESFAGVRLGFRFSGAMISNSLIQLCFNWSLFWPENRAFNFPAQFTM